VIASAARRPDPSDADDNNDDEENEEDVDDDGGGSQSDGDCSYLVTKDLLLEIDANAARNLDNTKT
jgi:hypothetical protein